MKEQLVSMQDPREFEHINRLLGEHREHIEETLNGLKYSELEQIDEALSYLDFDSEPYKEWRAQLANDHPTTMFSELVLMWHARSALCRDAVTLKAGIPHTGKDFDLLVQWDGRDYWIEVTKPQFVKRLEEKGGGFISWNWTRDSILRKLDSDFAPARDNLSSDPILVLAVYMEALQIQQDAVTRWLERTDNHPGKYCDAFIEYSHWSDVTRATVRPLTDRGEHVQELITEISTEYEDA